MEPSDCTAKLPSLNILENIDSVIENDLELADQLVALGDISKAVKIYDAILLNFPTYAPALKARLIALTMSSCYEAALLDAKKLIELSPDDSVVLWQQAGLLRRIHGEQRDEVLQAYDAAYALDPQNLYLKIERADILRSHNRHIEAMDEFVQVAENADNEEILLEARYKEGCVAVVLGISEQARGAFSTVMEIDPHYEDVEIMMQLLV